MTTSDRWRLRAALFSLLYLLAAPLMALALAHRLWVRRKGLVGLREKISGDGPELPTGQIMMHGVSLGEVMLMRPLVPRLEAALGRRCVLTTTTETGRAALDQHFPDAPRAFLPLDLPWAVHRFICRLKPRLVVLLELEIWPLLLCRCFAADIPVVLINARVGDGSYRGYRMAAPLLRPLFRRLTLAMGQNAAWTARLVKLGVRRENAVACGSMKADMVKRASAAECANVSQRFGLDAKRPLLLIASTSADEEDRILRAWLGMSRPDWRVIACPRHPERGAEVAAVLKKHGFDAVRSTQTTEPTNQAVVVDEIGQLAALYAACAASNGIAVVGGSFGSGRGGQNMFEAAAAGCCTVVGWDTRNFPDAMAALRTRAGVVEVNDHNLPEMLSALAADAPRRAAIAEIGHRAWEASQGACERTVQLLTARLGGRL